MAVPGGPAPGFFAAYRDWLEVPPPSWADIAWLRAQWSGPFLVKGVMRPDDARRAVFDAGATAVSVSNHGGNNLDGTPASVRALPGVAAAVGDNAEVLLDGGIRRGGDVVKALALGARAIMIGRPCLWGLAAGGPAGVRNVFDILRGGIDSALLSLGRASVHDLDPSDVIVPADFAGCDAPDQRAARAAPASVRGVWARRGGLACVARASAGYVGRQSTKGKATWMRAGHGSCCAPSGPSLPRCCGRRRPRSRPGSSHRWPRRLR